jgi:predicted nucleic acid-binding protein
MDAYLAAFAMAGGLQITTFDHGFASFQPAGLNLLMLQSR